MLTIETGVGCTRGWHACAGPRSLMSACIRMDRLSNLCLIADRDCIGTMLPPDTRNAALRIQTHLFYGAGVALNPLFDNTSGVCMCARRTLPRSPQKHDWVKVWCDGVCMCDVGVDVGVSFTDA